MVLDILSESSDAGPSYGVVPDLHTSVCLFKEQDDFTACEGHVGVNLTLLPTGLTVSSVLNWTRHTDHRVLLLATSCANVIRLAMDMCASPIVAKPMLQ